MSEKRFEEVLRERFAEATSMPDPGLKEKIFAAGKAARQRRMYSLISVAASLSVILVSLLLIFTRPETKQPVRADLPEKQVIDSLSSTPEMPVAQKEKLPEKVEDTSKSNRPPITWLAVVSGEEPRQLELPDGSKVHLNKNSRVRYREDFVKNRQVELRGEAFFEVVKSANQFRVTTSQLQVTVLGTSFDVLDSNGENAAVYTVSGKVKVSTGNAEVILLANDYCRVENQSLKKGEAFDQNHLAWKTGILSFQQKPVAEVVNALEKYYSINIDLQVEQECLVTSTFIKKDLLQALEMLTKITGLKTEKTENGYLLTGNCR